MKSAARLGDSAATMGRLYAAAPTPAEHHPQVGDRVDTGPPARQGIGSAHEHSRPAGRGPRLAGRAPRARPPARRPGPHGWRIGTLAGTPVYLGRSWPVIAVLIVVVFGPNLARPDRGASYGYLLAAGYAVLLLVSVLVHEAAHALAARWRGHPVSRIVADVWGGHTVYDATRSSPTTTAVVAVVGPLANLVLAAVVWAIQAVATNETADTLLGIVAVA